MLKIAKYLLYLGIAALIVVLFWFMPKYSYVQKNPGYCANLTTHLYYCGTQADLKDFFNKTTNSNTDVNITNFNSNLNTNFNLNK